MICPHCNHQIREEDRYLMSRNPDGEMVWPDWAVKAAAYLILFLILVGALVIQRAH